MPIDDRGVGGVGGVDIADELVSGRKTHNNHFYYAVDGFASIDLCSFATLFFVIYCLVVATEWWYWWMAWRVVGCYSSDSGIYYYHHPPASMFDRTSL